MAGFPQSKADKEAVAKEEKRVAELKKQGWTYTEWGEFVPPVVEVSTKKAVKKSK